jgi:hypothetical protein
MVATDHMTGQGIEQYRPDLPWAKPPLKENPASIPIGLIGFRTGENGLLKIGASTQKIHQPGGEDNIFIFGHPEERHFQARIRPGTPFNVDSEFVEKLLSNSQTFLEIMGQRAFSSRRQEFQEAIVALDDMGVSEIDPFIDGKQLDPHLIEWYWNPVYGKGARTYPVFPG